MDFYILDEGSPLIQGSNFDKNPSYSLTKGQKFALPSRGYDLMRTSNSLRLHREPKESELDSLRTILLLSRGVAPGSVSWFKSARSPFFALSGPTEASTLIFPAVNYIFEKRPWLLFGTLILAPLYKR